MSGRDQSLDLKPKSRSGELIPVLWAASPVGAGLQRLLGTSGAPQNTVNTPFLWYFAYIVCMQLVTELGMWPQGFRPSVFFC